MEALPATPTPYHAHSVTFLRWYRCHTVAPTTSTSGHGHFLTSLQRQNSDTHTPEAK